VISKRKRITTAAENRYRRKYAKGYEAERSKHPRWHMENEIVHAMLQTLHGTVLDVPVGAGRFLSMYQKLKLACTGVDVSEDMLALAKAKRTPCQLECGNATALRFEDRSFDHVVCVRLFHMLDELDLIKVMKELCRIARHNIIFTIRLGDVYSPKKNVATHNTLKFKALIKRCGWDLAEEQPIFKQGWYVIRLIRREQ
jgi:ubiquinone/menaquinone biosynthesis C-methylase UbiE